MVHRSYALLRTCIDTEWKYSSQIFGILVSSSFTSGFNNSNIKFSVKISVLVLTQPVLWRYPPTSSWGRTAGAGNLGSSLAKSRNWDFGKLICWEAVGKGTGRDTFFKWYYECKRDKGNWLCQSVTKKHIIRKNNNKKK